MSKLGRLVILAGVLPVLLIALAGAAPSPPIILGVVALDSTLHVDIGGTNSQQFTLLEVHDASTGELQQSKITSGNARAIQANGLEPMHPYTVTVSGLSPDGTRIFGGSVMEYTSAPTHLPNEAFNDNFNEAVPGAMSSNLYDIRTSYGSGQRPESVNQADKFLTFVSELHIHTQMLGGKQRGELYIRPRVQVDLSDNMTRTLITEMDFSATHHIEGKWPEIHLVGEDNVPWSAQEFGAGEGDGHPNSVEFSTRFDRGGNTSNFPGIGLNLGGTEVNYISTQELFTPVNIRLPVKIEVSRRGAKFYINQQLVAQATFPAPLPFTRGYFILAHRTWYSARDRITAPVANQVVHWDNIIFDGPAGTSLGTAVTGYQGCPPVTRMEVDRVQDCPRLDFSSLRERRIFIWWPGEPQLERRTRLLFVGNADSGSIQVKVNTTGWIDVPVRSCTGTPCYLEHLNYVEIPPGKLYSGLNQIYVRAQNAQLSNFQLETETSFSPRFPTPAPHEAHGMVNVTSNNVRIDARSTGIYTFTTYLYNAAASEQSWQAEVLGDAGDWLSVSPSEGTVFPPAVGGIQRLDLRVDTSQISTDDDGEVGIVRIVGPEGENIGGMPVYIGVMLVTSGVMPNFRTNFPLTTNYILPEAR